MVDSSCFLAGTMVRMMVPIKKLRMYRLVIFFLVWTCRTTGGMLVSVIH